MAKPKITPREKMIMDLIATKAGQPYAEATATVQKLSDKALDLNELLLLKSLNTRAVSKLDMDQAIKDIYMTMLETITQVSKLKGVNMDQMQMDQINMDQLEGGAKA